jgi:hypothetical protein
MGGADVNVHHARAGVTFIGFLFRRYVVLAGVGADRCVDAGDGGNRRHLPTRGLAWRVERPLRRSTSCVLSCAAAAGRQCHYYFHHHRTNRTCLALIVWPGECGTIGWSLAGGSTSFGFPVYCRWLRHAPRSSGGCDEKAADRHWSRNGTGRVIGPPNQGNQHRLSIPGRAIFRASLSRNCAIPSSRPSTSR